MQTEEWTEERRQTEEPERTTSQGDPVHEAKRSGSSCKWRRMRC